VTTIPLSVWSDSHFGARKCSNVRVDARAFLGQEGVVVGHLFNVQRATNSEQRVFARPRWIKRRSRAQCRSGPEQGARRVELSHPALIWLWVFLQYGILLLC